MGLVLTGKQQAEAYRLLCDKTVEVATPKVMIKVLEMMKEQEEVSKKEIEEKLIKFFTDVEQKVDLIIKERMEDANRIESTIKDII